MKSLLPNTGDNGHGDCTLAKCGTIHDFSIRVAAVGLDDNPAFDDDLLFTAALQPADAGNSPMDRFHELQIFSDRSGLF